MRNSHGKIHQKFNGKTHDFKKAIYTGYVKEPEGNIAMENGSLIDHKNDDLAIKMVIFHSYVKIPEGKCSGSMMQMNHATGYNWAILISQVILMNFWGFRHVPSGNLK